MNAPARQHKEPSTTTATVIPFPHPASTEQASTAPSGSLADYFSLNIEQIQEELKAAVEAFVAESYYRLVLSQRHLLEDPFDSVFISSLKPDPFSTLDIERIEAFYSIEDLSDQIRFNDGWDD